jgi:S-adenosylmethionine hydrolase
VDKLVATYSEAEAGTVCALFGSTEHLEIAVNGASAAERLQLARGAPVTISRS